MQKKYLSLTFYFFMIIISCKNEKINKNQDDSKVINSSKIDEKNQKKCNLEDSKYDTSKLVSGSFENLDVYNGIKGFKLGKNIDEISTCINCDTSSNLLKCLYIDTLSFLNTKWLVEIVAKDKTIIGIKLNLKYSEADRGYRYSHDVNEIYRKLVNIFGNPNIQKLKIDKSNFEKVNFKVEKFSNNAPESFEENLKDMFNYIEAEDPYYRDPIITKNGITYMEPTIVEKYNENFQWHKKGYVGKTRDVFEDPIGIKNVHVRHYPEVKFSAKWRSNVSLNINITRNSVINDFYFVQTEKHDEESYFGYVISRYWTINLFMFSDQNTIEFYEKVKLNLKNKEKQKTIDLSKDQKKDYKESLLKEF